jgi:hypothetical protein
MIVATVAETSNQAANPPNTATARAAPTSQSIELTSAFIMAPFLCDAIFNEKSLNPLELIIIAQDAAIEFDAHHRGVVGFANTSATVHANAFANWALAIHLGNSPLTPTMMSSRIFHRQDTPIAFCCHLEQQDSSHMEL